MKITKVMMDRTKNNIERFDINLIPKSKINMVNERTTFSKTHGGEEDSSAMKSKFIQLPRSVEVENIRQNIVITLNNMGEKFIASIGVKADTVEALPEILENAMADMRSRMKHSYDEIVAFVTGGIHYDANPDGDRSVELFDSIYDTLVKGEKMPTTILAEQKIDFYDKNQKGVGLYAIRDMLNLYGGIINDIKGIKPATGQEVEEAVNQMFDFVEISKAAPVKFMENEPVILTPLKR